MDIWQRLGIAATDDLAAIKHAYHIKLRDCHPEDDPEGFRLLREAYEKASQPPSTVVHTTEPPADLVRAAEAPELTALLELLRDGKRRFVMAEWDKWQASLQQLTLVQQSQLSNEVLKHIFNWQWLPSPLIERLWQALDWAALLRRTDDQQKDGEFLDWWRQVPLCVPLDWLATLDHARQRAVLSFYQPLLQMLEACDYNGVQTFIRYQALQIVGDHPNLVRLQLRALRAVGDNIDVTHCLSLALTLLEQKSLSEDDWYLLSDAALRCGKEQLVMQVAEGLMEREYKALLANHLINWYLNSEPELARWLQAFSTSQNWPTARSPFWEPQWLALPQQQVDPIEEWLKNQMLGSNEAPLTSLELESIPGVRGALARLWWSSEYGTWHSLEAMLTQPELAEAQGGWHYVSSLLQQHARRKLAERPELPQLDAMLERYGSDDWLNVSPPDAEQIGCATPEQWIEYLRRYPLIPDSWFIAIEQRAIDEDWSNRMFEGTHLGGRLSLQRNGEASKIALTDAWNGTGWVGCFRWALFYYSFSWIPRFHLKALCQTMGTLPSNQDDTPLASMLSFGAQPLEYQAQIIDVCARWPQQNVLSIELRNQTQLLQNSEESDQSLFERARQNELPALAALISRRVNNESDLASTIVLWDLLYCHRYYNRAYRYIAAPLRSRIKALAQQQGWDLETNSYTEASMMFAYLCRAREALPTLEELEKEKPNEEAAQFIYPCCYGLSILARDFTDNGFKGDLLDPLYKQPEALTPPQQEACTLLLGYLEDKLNDQLEHDRIHAKERFRLKSTGWMISVGILSAILTYFALPLTPSLSELITNQANGTDYYDAGFHILAMLALNFSLAFQICRCCTRQRTKLSYVIWLLVWIGIAFYSNSAWLAIPIWFTHVMMSFPRQGMLRQSWPTTFYKQGRITFSDLLKPS